MTLAALSSMGSKFSPSAHKGGTLSTAKLRFRLRDTAAKILPGEAVRRCGKFAIGEQFGDGPGWVEVKVSDHGADVCGVVTCGSVWNCPVCAAKVAGQRRRAIGSMLLRHKLQGGGVYMATFTLRHHPFQDPKELRQVVSKSFSKVIAGAPWQRQKKATTTIGYIRALEVTHGAKGWHPHLHVLFLTDVPLADGGAAFGAWMFQRWAAAIERAGFGVCSPDAFDFQQAHTAKKAGEYVLKGALEYEVTHAHLKQATGGNR